MSDYDYQGFHATADILLKNYPSNMVELFEESLKYSKLNVVADKVHDFGGAVTAVYVLSESSATLHEYPEHNYVTVDVYTCGKEGDPVAAINHFLSLLDVEDFVINFLNRGQFQKETIDISGLTSEYWNAPDQLDMQDKLDNITNSLSTEQIEQLKEILEWTKAQGLEDMAQIMLNEQR